MEALRSFGERHQDLPPMVELLAKLLRLLALDLDQRHSVAIPLIYYVNVATGFTCFVYVYLISAYYYIFWRDADLLTKIILFSLGNSSLLVLIKLIFMYINRHSLKNLVSEYLHCDAAVAVSSRMRSNVRAALRSVRRRAALFWILVNSNGLMYVLRPLLTPGRRLLEDHQILLGLEPVFESPNYEIALVVEGISVYFIVYVTATITAFHIIIVGYTEALMLALSQELLHLWKDAQNHYEIINRISSCDSNQETYYNSNQNEETPVSIQNQTDFHPTEDPNNHTDVILKTKFINDYIRRGLLGVIKRHAVNIKLINQIEGIFENAMAIEFALLSVSLIAELLGGLENTYIQALFAFVQVGVDCVTGQKLRDACLVFEEAVYDCKWENFDLRNMKLILVLLQKAQKPLELSAGGVIILNNVTLMSVIRSVYSAYTALRSTMN